MGEMSGGKKCRECDGTDVYVETDGRNDFLLCRSCKASRRVVYGPTNRLVFKYHGTEAELEIRENGSIINASRNVRQFVNRPIWEFLHWLTASYHQYKVDSHDGV